MRLGRSHPDGSAIRAVFADSTSVVCRAGPDPPTSQVTEIVGIAGEVQMAVTIVKGQRPYGRGDPIGPEVELQSPNVTRVWLYAVDNDPGAAFPISTEKYPTLAPISRNRQPGLTKERSRRPSSGSQLWARCMNGRITWSFRLIQNISRIDFDQLELTVGQRWRNRWPGSRKDRSDVQFGGHFVGQRSQSRPETRPYRFGHAVSPSLAGFFERSRVVRCHAPN